MSQFFKQIVEQVKKTPFFYILLGIILFVAFVSIKPGFAFLGWDNYSSYFNIKNNLVKNFFDSWREFRGLGVPSDSESTDVPRQVFFFISSFIIPENILDQLYFVLSMAAGVITTYFLFSTIIHPYEKLRKYADIGGFVAGLFYLFNLHTLSVYYFPITPYVTRYFAIPVLLLAFYTVFTEKHISIKKYAAIIAAVFLCAPSYVIGTVFVTLVMAIGIFSLFQSGFKRVMLVGIVFILLNSYWLLPFFNYTIEKSTIIRLAPTFISANETQLNKPKSFYNPASQLILAPNFFDTEVTNITLDESSFLHPLADIFNTFPYYPIFAIFPLLYITGSVLILIYFKEYKRLLWIPIIIFLYTFFSLKEFSPIGFIYQFLNRFIPYFEVIFRFGDTKFHPYISFSGALAAAFAVTFILNYTSTFKKKDWHQTAYGVLGIFIFLTFFVFRYYFTGEFLGFFMYNKIPPAYKEISAIINNDPEDFRVVHLPYDDYVYWRSYSWGYVGSSFLNYMIDKPLFDKTFEPASMENAHVMQRIQDLLHNSQSLTEVDLKKRSQEFYSLMSMLGVKYIILDETVSATQFPRGMNLWGTFNYPEASIVLQNLENNNLAEKAYVGEVPIREYMEAYDKVFDIDSETEKIIENSVPEQIIMYKLAGRSPKVEFLPKATRVDPNFEHELLSGNTTPEIHTIKNKDKFVIFPFLRKNASLQKNETALELSMNSIPPGAYRFEKPETTGINSYLIELKGYLSGANVVITSYLHYYPTVNGTRFSRKIAEVTAPISEIEKSLTDITDKELLLSDWKNIPQNKITNLRLQINNTIVPVPLLTTSEQTIGYSLIEGEEINIKILKRDTVTEVPLDSIQFTDTKNCYNDALNGYAGTIQVANGEFQVTSQNGSTCFWRDLVSVVDDDTTHIELEVELNGTNSDLDPEFVDKYDFSSKPKLTNTVQNLEKPNTIEICIKQNNIDDCFNTHKLFNIPKEKTKIRVPAVTQVTNVSDMLIFFALKNTQYQKQLLGLQSFVIHAYSPIAEENYSIAEFLNTPAEFEVKENSLTVEIPYTLSPRSYSYNSKTDMLLTSNNPCAEEGTYRTFRTSNDRFVSYLEDCQNRVFTHIPFSSSSFYLWSIDYNLASGQYPKLVLEDGFYKYLGEYISLYQGYPEVSGFKAFQYPELPFQQGITPLQNLPIKNSYTYIYPHPEYNDLKQKDFSIEHFSENEGMMLIEGFDIVELPNYWQNLQIVPAQGTTEIVHSTAVINKYSSILPSLKRVKIGVEGRKGLGALLKFNEAYDRQWGVYGSVLGAVLGQSIEMDHEQCDGYANCFIIPTEFIAEGETVYLYYWPQTLSFIGWIATVITIAVGWKLLGKA